MKNTTYTDHTGKAWETCELSALGSDRHLIAPRPKWDYYSGQEVYFNSGLWAVFDTSMVTGPVHHCIKVEQYNDFIDAYALDFEVNEEQDR